MMSRAGQQWPSGEVTEITIPELRRYMFNGLPLCLHVENGEQCARLAIADERIYGGHQRCPEHKVSAESSQTS